MAGDCAKNWRKTGAVRFGFVPLSVPGAGIRKHPIIGDSGDQLGNLTRQRIRRAVVVDNPSGIIGAQFH